MEREYKCKCGKPASFFYMRGAKEKLIIYNSPSYWDRFYPDDFQGYVFICSTCGIKLLTIEKLKGGISCLEMKRTEETDSYDRVTMNESEYIRTCG